MNTNEEPINLHEEMYSGMTLRDKFAAHALVAKFSGDIGFPNKEKLTNIAIDCYRIADAMLEARDL